MRLRFHHLVAAGLVYSGADASRVKIGPHAIMSQIAKTGDVSADDLKTLS